MTQESRKKKDETIAKNCGNCIHNKVCKYKDCFGSVVSRAIHEVQADDYFVDVLVNCKHHADKYGLSEKE